MIPRFPVYLFDIDGTLLDSAADICGAVQHVLASASTPKDVPFEYLKSFIGLHLIDLFSDVYPDHSAPQIDGLIQQYRTAYLARGHAQTRVYSGVSEGLAALGGRKATATTKGSATTRAVLEQFGLIQYFDHVQGTDGFPCKPAPDVVLTALAALGAQPEDCLFGAIRQPTWKPAAARGCGPARCAMGTGRRMSWRGGRRIIGWGICGSWCDGGLDTKVRILAVGVK